MKKTAPASSIKNKVLSIKYICALVFCLLILLFVFPQNSFAALSACSATVDPPIANVDSNTTFSVQVTNGDDSGTRMVWMKVVRPSADYAIAGFSDNGLPVSQSESEFSTWGFDAGYSSAFGQNITASANNDSTFTGYWIVLASDDPGGADPVTCTGTLDARIFDPINSVPPTISDLTISDITSTSVKVSWTTDKVATSVVDYGATSDYGLTKNDAALSTSHGVTVDGLTANTVYHYRVTSVDDHSNTTSTADNTLTSALTGSTITTTTTVVVVTQAATSTTTVPRVVPDTTPPSIYIATDFSKPFKEAPKISGHATDNKAVVRIEYSLDNGRNWQPVDNFSAKGGPASGWDFTPSQLDDDNYKVKVRAVDSSGNVGSSKIYTMVIDRLSPDVGQSFFSLGPQPLVPDSNGIILALEGLDQKITLSLVGGPITVDIKSNNQMFSLTKNTDNGLWSGVLNFDKPGVYPLVVSSIDGAGNKSERTLHSIAVLPQGSITHAGKPVANATVTIYYFDPLTKNFVIWDGASYGQKNPQKTDSKGKYAFFMPSGTYYLEVNAPTFRTLKSNIFIVDQSIPVYNNLVLEKKQGIQIGPLNLSFFDFNVTSADVALSYPTIPNEFKQLQNLVGKSIPDVDIKNLDSTSFETGGLAGKPTLLTFLSTWDPFTPVQLGILNSVKSKTEAALISVFPQEKASKIYIYRKRGNYDISMLADPDGLLVKPLDIQTMPLHLFLSRKGVIQKVMYGVISENEILGNLIN